MHRRPLHGQHAGPAAALTEIRVHRLSAAVQVALAISLILIAVGRAAGVRLGSIAEVSLVALLVAAAGLVAARWEQSSRQ